MTADLSWLRSGDPRDLAVEFALFPDPDAGSACEPADSASWGAFRVWADGRNLCEHQVGDTTENAVHWYLLPFFEWLAGNWDALLHEERLPLGGHGIDARHAYYQTVRLVLGSIDPGSEKKSIAWERWWKRHALRACRSGGVFPDIFIRRLRDTIELSWGDQRLPGLPSDFYFTVPPGRLCLPVSIVADVFRTALVQAAAAMEAAGLQRLERVRGFISAVRSIIHKDPDEQAAWFVEAHQQDVKPHRIVDFIHRYATTVDRDIADALFKDEVDNGYIKAFSQAALMFSSANPQIGDNDLLHIADVLVQSFSGLRDPAALRPLVRQEGVSPDRPPFREGYDLALDLLEQLKLPKADEASVDVEKIVKMLNIRVVRRQLVDSRIRGLTIAGPTTWPTVLVNMTHPANKNFGGERFSIAHELCHVLYDREYGRGVALASGPWAPEALERRANAFAAMVLMPPAVIDRAITISQEPPQGLSGIKKIADLMQTGVMTTVEHLTNIGRIDEPDRELLLSEWDNRAT